MCPLWYHNSAGIYTNTIGWIKFPSNIYLFVIFFYIPQENEKQKNDFIYYIRCKTMYIAVIWQYSRFVSFYLQCAVMNSLSGNTFFSIIQLMLGFLAISPLSVLLNCHCLASFHIAKKFFIRISKNIGKNGRFHWWVSLKTWNGINLKSNCKSRNSIQHWQ